MEGDQLIDRNAKQEKKATLDEINEKYKKQYEKKPKVDKVAKGEDKINAIFKKLLTKLEALCWIIIAVFIIYFSNFFHVLFHHENVNETFLTIFLICVGILCAMTLYVVVILPYVLKVEEDFETYNPRLVKVGAVAGFSCFISLIIAVFPAFGWYSPLMVMAMLFGYINVGHFVPGNLFGSFIVSFIFVGAFFSFHLIEHNGHFHY